VVGTVRSDEKARKTLSDIPEALRSHIILSVVEDIVAPNAFDNVGELELTTCSVVDALLAGD
jgi:hypothetical protein